MTSSRTRRSRTSSRTPRRIPTSSCSRRAAFMARRICRLALFEKAAGIKLRHLPTNGGGPASPPCSATIAIARAIDFRHAQHIKAGKLRAACASFGAKRSKALPDVPTLKELATTSNTICGSAFSRRKARRRRSFDARCAMRSKGRTSTSSRPRSPISATISAISISRTSPILGRGRQARDEAVRSIGKVDRAGAPCPRSAGERKSMTCAHRPDRGHFFRLLGIR